MRGRVYAGRIPGKAIRIDESGIEILCGTGSVTITEWEEEGSGVPESPSVLVRSITTTLQ
jgi:methionyl-tRNA formyltransferase